MLQCSPYAQEKLVFLEWLQDVVVGTATDRIECGRHVMHGCDHDHGDFRIIGTQPGEKLQAVHFRHEHVAEHQVNGGSLQVLDCQAAVSHCTALVALAFQQRRDYLAYRLFVINDKDLGFTHFRAPQKTETDATVIIRGVEGSLYDCSGVGAELVKYVYAHELGGKWRRRSAIQANGGFERVYYEWRPGGFARSPHTKEGTSR
jgi:hypothetical protein